MLGPMAGDEHFPFEAVRDLLGVVRAVYSLRKAERAGRAELAKIAKVGTELSEAIDLAVSTRPGSIGHRAAWERAEGATRSAGELVDGMMPAEPLVLAARRRVCQIAGAAKATAAIRKRREER